MDLRFLQTFVHVVELGSVAQAARHLGLTSASVKQRLHALEADMNSRLLARSGRTVQPTPAGRRILADAKRLLDQARDLRSLASDTALPAGPLRLGVTPSAMNSLVPAALTRWFAARPDIEIYIEPGTTKSLYERMLTAELDAALHVHPGFDLPKQCAWRAVRSEPMVLVTPPDMAVSSVSQTLLTQHYICYDRSVTAGRLADDYLRQRGIRPRIRLELDGIDAIARLVSEGLGVSILPDAGTFKQTSAPVATWPLPAPVPSRIIGLSWLRSGIRAPLAHVFADDLVANKGSFANKGV